MANGPYSCHGAARMLRWAKLFFTNDKEREGDMLYQPVYRIMGLERRKDLMLGSCVFSIALNLDFAKQARQTKVDGQFQRKFQDIAREMVDYKSARVNFLGDTALLRTFSVEGNCACMGFAGSVIDGDWNCLSYLEYHGHNIDGKHQAYDLLTIFTYWADTVESLFFSQQRSVEMGKS